MKRIITALIGITLVVFVVKFTPPVVSIALIFLAMVLALTEYYTMLGERVPHLFRWPGYLLAAVILFSFYFSSMAGLPAFFLPASTILLLLAALFSRLEPDKSFYAAVLAFFGSWYAGGLMGFVVGIRMLGTGAELGANLLLMLFCIIWAGDIFAYFAGRAFGKHKLAPVISPKKTVEGAIAGLIFSALAAVLCRYTFIQELTAVDAAAAGVIVGLFGQIGDLCESVIKRSVHVKDSGVIVPGHGGMLDRIDSILFGAPALYYYFHIVIKA